MPTPGGLPRRLAAGCVLAAVLVLPVSHALAVDVSGPVAVEAGPQPPEPAASATEIAAAGADASAAPVGVGSGRDRASVEEAAIEVGPPLTGQPPAAAHARLPEAPALRPDPQVVTAGPVVPVASPKPPTETDPPTTREWNRLLDRLARSGARPVTDESGRVVLDVDRLLVLTGGTAGLDELRSWGAEIVAEHRPGVYTVRSQGRVVARYVLTREPAPEPPTGAPPGPTTSLVPDFGAPPELPATGGSVADSALVALGGAGIVCAGALLVRCFRRPRRG